MAYKYKTRDGSEVVIPGIGQTENGIIESPVKLENANLELLKSSSPALSGHVTGVAPQQDQTAPAPVVTKPVEEQK